MSDKKIQLAYSPFSITCNSNVRFDSIGSDQAKLLFKQIERASEKLFDDQEILKHITYRKGSQADITKVECCHVTSIGDTHGLLHMHAFLKISHRASLQLNLDTLRQFYKKAMQPYSKEIHLHVKLLKTKAEQVQWLKYLEKNSHDTLDLSEFIKNVNLLNSNENFDE